MQQDRAARPSFVVLAYLAVSVLWGSTYLAIRVALDGFPPFFLGALRFLASGAVLYVIARLRGERAPRKAEWGACAVTGGLLFVIGNGFVNLAERSVSSGMASVLVATMPLWATVFARLLGERVSRLEQVGLTLGLLGVLVMNLGGELRASQGGALVGLLAPIAWALGSIAGKRLPVPRGSMGPAAQMLAGGAGALVVSAALGEHPAAAPSLGAVLAVAYLCVFGSLVGFTAYVYLLRHTRASVATSYAYVNPIIALALGVLLGGERIDFASGVGTALVLAAVLLVSQARRRRGPAGVHARSLAAQEPASGQSTVPKETHGLPVVAED